MSQDVQKVRPVLLIQALECHITTRFKQYGWDGVSIADRYVDILLTDDYGACFGLTYREGHFLFDNFEQFFCICGYLWSLVSDLFSNHSAILVFFLLDLRDTKF